MRAASDFESVMRRGHKSGKVTVVVYLARTAEPMRVVGFAVSKAVGGAVVRNRVRRRLRAIIAGELSSLPVGARVVVRALPAAAAAPFSALSSDVRSALTTACARAET
jgi:ribonuclease P protein component